jgi:hypothetical protein
MAEIERKTKRYPTDLTDEEWARIKPLLPGRSKRGRPREVDLREIMNAIRYLVRTGCGWRMLPKDFRLGRRSIGGFGALCGNSCSGRSTMCR